MRCFSVLIHGAFKPLLRFDGGLGAEGFYTTRWVVAASQEKAIGKAFHSARRELEKWRDVRDGLIAVEMEAEEVTSGSWWRWLKSGGRGFAFYTGDGAPF